MNPTYYCFNNVNFLVAEISSYLEGRKEFADMMINQFINPTIPVDESLFNITFEYLSLFFVCEKVNQTVIKIKRKE
jgi:hypothetical protein